ncbi:MAG: hypothetical protein HGGPFJEG_02043 [Ignavibacteria bacterium]|nr:hypothetical protein [Ignavibacteria bacterium]
MKKEYYVYILYSEHQKKTYVGHTNDLLRRIFEHNTGKVKTTKKYKPLKLIYKEKYHTRDEVRAREVNFKTSTGRKKIKKILINAEMAELVDLLRLAWQSGARRAHWTQ